MKTTYKVNWHEINQMMESAPHGSKRAVIQQLERAYGLSYDQIYRYLRKHRGPKKLVERNSKVADEVISTLAEIKIKGVLATDAERFPPTWKCIEYAISNGLISKENCPSVATANRLLAERFGLNDQQPRVLWRCDHALEDVQIDFSNSKHFRISHYDEERGDYVLKASPRPLSYRRNPNREKVILCGIHDKYSGLTILRASAGCAESLPILMEAMNFWLVRPADDHMMRHLGFELAHDNGSVFKTQEWNELVKALGVTERSSKPYKKTGIGAVERKWRSFWSDEVMWSFDYPTLYLSEFNELAHMTMTALQDKPHTYLSMSKGEAYRQSILRHVPKTVDVNLMDLACKTYERKVDLSLRIQIDGEDYAVPQHVQGMATAGKRVRVYRNLRGELLAELVDHFGATFALEPYTYRKKGDFSGTPKEVNREKMEKVAQRGDKWVHERIIAAKEVTTGPQVRKLVPQDRPADIQSKFAPQPATAKAPEQFASLIEARIYVGSELKPYGITFDQVAPFFLPALQQNLEKPFVAALVQDFLNAYKQTGTEG